MSIGHCLSKTGQSRFKCGQANPKATTNAPVQRH